MVAVVSTKKVWLDSDAPLIEVVCSEIILTSLLISRNEKKLRFTSLKSCAYCPSFATYTFHSFIEVFCTKSKVHVEIRWKVKVPLH